MKPILSPNYAEILTYLKEKIRTARMNVSLNANSHLLQIYWEIGKTILEQQEKEGWGTKVIDHLAIDLRIEFPDFKGLSIRNLKYMRTFAEAYPCPLVSNNYFSDSNQQSIVQPLVAQLKESDFQDNEFVQLLVAQIPWTHHIIILDKVRPIKERLFYIQKTSENNWSKSVLRLQIGNKLFIRQGNAITNFSITLPSPQSDLAQETIKNPYVFDFLSMGEKIQEKELEKALIQHLKQFMLELGRGFAYVGNQFNIDVDGSDYFLDMLFYNFKLKCFVIFELKVSEFKPEYAGKLNFYINTINEQIKSKDDNPTIGILLCKTPSDTIVKYALKGIQTPIGIADYEFAQALPKQLKGEIPSIEELEAEIDKEYEELKSPVDKRLDAIKQKLAKIKGEEIRVTASHEILCNIYDESLKPLFYLMIKKLKNLEDQFVSCTYYWGGKTKIDKIEDLDREWKKEDYFKERILQYFALSLNGLKKAGVQAFNINVQLNYRIDQYWYGFELLNYNNHQPFIKKLYHEQLSKVDIELICDTFYNRVFDEIEERLKNLKLDINE